MTQKRFKKLLMAQGYSTNAARALVECIKVIRRSIEQGDNLLLLADAETGASFKVARVYPYAETYKRLQRDQGSIGKEP